MSVTESIANPHSEIDHEAVELLLSLAAEAAEEEHSLSRISQRNRHSKISLKGQLKERGSVARRCAPEVDQTRHP